MGLAVLSNWLSVGLQGSFSSFLLGQKEPALSYVPAVFLSVLALSGLLWADTVSSRWAMLAGLILAVSMVVVSRYLNAILALVPSLGIVLWLRYRRRRLALTFVLSVTAALLLPLLVFVLIGGADLARAYAIQLAVQNAARAGAEAYAITSTPTIGLAQAAAVGEMNRTPTVQATNSNVAVSEGQADGSTCVHPPPPSTPAHVHPRVRTESLLRPPTVSDH